MEENSQLELEVELYEEIVNLNYSIPMASTAPSPFRYEENLSNITHFNGPIMYYSESKVVSTSTGPVASVTWPTLRYPCSLAGSYQEPRLLKHQDGTCATETFCYLRL